MRLRRPRRAAAQRSGRARGFTLLEIAVGMAVLGIGVVAALQVFGSALQVARRAARKAEAVVQARALMDSALWVPHLRESVSHGVIGDGFRWERSVRRAGAEEGLKEDELPPADLRLAVISVVVEWDEPSGVKSYRIGTMRIVPNDG